MSALLVGAGFWRQQEAKGAPTAWIMQVPGLHRQIERAAELGGTDRLEKAEFVVNPLTGPGGPVIVAALLAMLYLRLNANQVRDVFITTFRQMAVPIPTIVGMLALSYVTRYSGMDATLGVAFAATGVLYPFFAAMLGCMGTFLTGSDSGSNALFGNLQKITATNVHASGLMPLLSQDQAQVLMCTANSTGGVMGKMIDAQSICVATAATNQTGNEGAIFRSVIWHSLISAAVVGVMTLAQAYWLPGMVP